MQHVSHRPPPAPPAAPAHPAGLIALAFSLPGRPHGLTIAPNGRFCVSQIDGGSISCGTLNDSTAVVTSTLEIGPGSFPAHVALDPSGRFAYTANQGANTASIVDVSSSRVVGTVPLADGGFNVLASADRAFVTTASGQLDVIDATSREVIAHVSVGAAANGLALDSAGGRLYVSSRDAGTVTVVSTVSNTIVRTHAVGPGAQRIALSPDRTTLYVASEWKGVQAIDLASGSISVFPSGGSGSGRTGAQSGWRDAVRHQSALGHRPDRECVDASGPAAVRRTQAASKHRVQCQRHRGTGDE